MAFTAVQVSFLQRLVADRAPTRQISAAAGYFSEHFSLGRVAGSRVEYTDAHFAAAERLLLANQLPVRALGIGATRAQAAEYGGMSEKDFSVAPHANSVAVKGLGSCSFDGHGLNTPLGAYMILTVEQARRVTCERLMVVENLETFRNLQEYTWVDRRGLAVLAIYRGEKDLPNRDAAELMRSRSEPIWGFFDFDPAGLAMANTLPGHRFERLLLPDYGWLEKSADTTRGRQLFDSQLRSYEKVLNAATNQEVVAAWGLMKRLRSAVTQERMNKATP
ncbi:MAG: hypothetical protein U1E04_07150 [Hylemonella sp.]|nr:hypothetical protein [Hylemonella sp.]